MHGDLELFSQFSYLGEDFLSELKTHAVLKIVEPKTEIFKIGQNVRHIPVVKSGLVKVYGMTGEKELLYYFIRPNESCIMTFSTIFTDQISKVFANCEEQTEILMLPLAQVTKWMVKYPNLNQFFFKQYELRYAAMMEMVNQAVFHRLDKRVLEYLHNRMNISGKTQLKISHKEIANDIGTAREVVSRILKKYENEGVITQHSSVIEFVSKL